MWINQCWDIEDVSTALLAASSQYLLIKLKYFSEQKYISQVKNISRLKLKDGYASDSRGTHAPCGKPTRQQR